MEILKKDVLSVVFKFMTFHEARTMRKVCRTFYKAWQTDSLWEIWAKQEFGDVDLQLDIADPTTWKVFFKIWWSGRRMASSTRAKIIADSFYKRFHNKACKFLVGDRFVKLRHGDIVENGEGERKIWHAKRGFFNLIRRTEQFMIDIPVEFSYPEFDFDHWRSIMIGGYYMAINMPPEIRKDLRIKLCNGLIEYYTDPRVNGIQFRPIIHRNWISVNTFDSLIRAKIGKEEVHYHLTCILTYLVPGQHLIEILLEQ